MSHFCYFIIFLLTIQTFPSASTIIDISPNTSVSSPVFTLDVVIGFTIGFSVFVFPFCEGTDVFSTSLGIGTIPIFQTD